MIAVEEAAVLARAQGAELVVVSVRPPTDAREVFDPSGLPDLAAHLDGLRTRLEGVKVRTRQESGDPAETLCDVAEDEGADVMVVGNRGTRGKRRWFLGSVPNAVVQHAPCSVLVVDTREAQ
jgi:nucleotide-binding universal stress UspA family protein